MNASELAAWLVEHAPDHKAKVYAVDQFGATQSPVMEARIDTEGNVILDIEAGEPEEPDEERVETKHGRWQDLPEF